MSPKATASNFTPASHRLVQVGSIFCVQAMPVFQVLGFWEHATVPISKYHSNIELVVKISEICLQFPLCNKSSQHKALLFSMSTAA